MSPKILSHVLITSLIPSLSALAAVSFDVTSFEGTELTFNDSATNFGTPETLNSLVAFTANGITYSADPFQALRPSGMTNGVSLQYQGPTSALYPTREDFLTVGLNGLSLSTGANLVASSDPPENWSFTRIFLDPNGVGDGVPDFLAADIANGQSNDLLELVDSNGTVLANLTLTSGDWNKLGEQNLARVSNVTGNVTNANFTNRHVLGVAIELSDFTNLSTGMALSSSDTATLDAISNLRIRVPGTGTQPRTDYAWIASNTDTIRFAEQVPEPHSAALLSLAFLALCRRRRT